MLDELGIQWNQEMSEVPLVTETAKPEKNKEAAAALDADADLQARLENLKRL